MIVSNVSFLIISTHCSCILARHEIIPPPFLFKNKKQRHVEQFKTCFRFYIWPEYVIEHNATLYNCFELTYCNQKQMKCMNFVARTPRSSQKFARCRSAFVVRRHVNMIIFNDEDVTVLIIYSIFFSMQDQSLSKRRNLPKSWWKSRMCLSRRCVWGWLWNR